MDDETELEKNFCISFPDTLAINKTNIKSQSAFFANLPVCCSIRKPASPSQQAQQPALCATCMKLLATQNSSTTWKNTDTGKLASTGPLMKHPWEIPFSKRPSPPDGIHPNTFISWALNLPSKQRHQDQLAQLHPLKPSWEKHRSFWECRAGTAFSSFRHILS